MHSVSDKTIVNLSDFTSDAAHDENAYIDRLDAIAKIDADEFVKVGIETNEALESWHLYPEEQ